jgi:hypothetical protein
MIRRLGYSTWAAYTGGDMWGGTMLGVCDSREDAESLVDAAFDGHLIGEPDRGERAYDAGREMMSAPAGARQRSTADDLPPMNEIGDRT